VVHFAEVIFHWLTSKYIMPRRGSKRKKSKTHQEDAPEGANIGGEGAAKADTPRSLVVRSSKV